jgi:FixJ family two-component response regulator
MASRFMKPSVHIVDDDDAVRDSLTAYLTLKGMNVVSFSSAQEALQHGEDAPDALILDVNMPEIDGFMLFEMLRQRGRAMPIIFVTGLGDTEMRLRAERMGASAFLDKPIDPVQLLSTLNRLLSDPHRDGPAEYNYSK